MIKQREINEQYARDITSLQQKVETNKIDDAFDSQVLRTNKPKPGEENEYQTKKI